jgi:hypothetical protein
MRNETTGDRPAEVTRVICASISQMEGSVMDELLKIRDRNCVPDAAPPVRGAVLYSRGWFVLWLEGDEAEIDTVMRKAASDPRNAHQKEIHRSFGAPTLTEPVTLVATQGAEGPGAFGRRVYHFRRQWQQGLIQEPAAIWQYLSAPCTVSDVPEREPDRHIALVSAENNGPIDLLRKLGEQSGSEVVYQRFARGQRHTSDVGVSYVDLVISGRVCRVQLLSRRALPHRMVRQAMVGTDSLVMLLGGKPAAAVELATAVAACLATLPAPPAICLVSESDEIAATIGGMLCQQMAHAAQAPALRRLQEAQLAEFIVRHEVPGAQGVRAGASGANARAWPSALAQQAQRAVSQGMPG